MASVRFGAIVRVFGGQLGLDPKRPVLKGHRELDCGCSFQPSVISRGPTCYDWQNVYGDFCDEHALALGKDAKGLPLRQMSLVPELRLDLAGAVIGGFDHYRREKIEVEVVLELGAIPGDTSYLTVTFPADLGYERDPEHYAGTFSVSVTELAATQEFAAHGMSWINKDQKRKWVFSWMLKRAVQASDRPGINISVQAANRVIAEDSVLGSLPDHEYSTNARFGWSPQTVVLSCGCAIEFHGWPATELDWYAGGSYAVLYPCGEHAWMHYCNRLVASATDGLPQWPKCSAEGTAEFPPCGAVFFPSSARVGEAQQAGKLECRRCPLARASYHRTRSQYGVVLNSAIEAPWVGEVPDPDEYEYFLVVQRGGRGCHLPPHPRQDSFAEVCNSREEAKRVFLERANDPHGPKVFLFYAHSRKVADQAAVVWMEQSKTEEGKACWQEIRQQLG